MKLLTHDIMLSNMAGNLETFQTVLHGSFSQENLPHVQNAHKTYSSHPSFNVIAPTNVELASYDSGFAKFQGEENIDRRLIELLYLSKIGQFGEKDFSHYINHKDQGTLGKSALYELGIDQALGNNYYFLQPPQDDPPIYVPSNSIWTPEELVTYVETTGTLPQPEADPSEKEYFKLWQNISSGAPKIAVGAMLQYTPDKSNEPRILLVRSDIRWNGLWTMVGTVMHKHESMDYARARGVIDETRLRIDSMGQDICTFDQIDDPNSHRRKQSVVFNDKVVCVENTSVKLSDQVQEYLWVPPQVALNEISNIEPNARFALKECHKQMIKRQ